MRLIIERDSSNSREFAYDGDSFGTLSKRPVNEVES
jgi:hypothetical protein